MTLSLNGIGVSRGIAIGKVHILERGQPEVTEYLVPKRKIKLELERFQAALDTAKQQLRDIRDRIPESTSTDIKAFIDTHILMLEDSALTTAPAQLIETHRYNAEWALKQQKNALVQVFEEMDDPYLRTRKDDVAHVVNRILRILLKQDHHSVGDRFLLKNAVVVADELTPADTILLQHQGILAFVTESGGPLSHTAIMARSLGIPAIVGVRSARRYLCTDERIIIDGVNGSVVADPNASCLKYYRKLKRQEKQYYAKLRKLKDAPAVTRDDQHISLQSNIELPGDLEALKDLDTAGVGLYRTEFQFMNRDTMPDEEEQLHAYKSVVEALKGRPVTIRTLDLGVDKQVSSQEAPDKPINPALGLRAVRLCLRDLSLFRPQLRAILRASAFGQVRIMIPMLSNLQELSQVIHLLDDTKRSLRKDGLKFDQNIPVGGMIEVPAAAICAKIFATHLDFFSIGTNDLIQYTLAIDRIDDEVNYLFDPLHPAVLQLIYSTLEAAAQQSIPVSMCGEMAGDCRYTRLLLGLGLREFSMHPSTLLEVKQIVTESNITELEQPALQILRCQHSNEAASLIERLNKS